MRTFKGSPYKVANRHSDILGLNPEADRRHAFYLKYGAA
jgi:hypothetical protein